MRRGVETRKGAVINGFLSRERITAGPGFNRWLIPPAALMVHLSIGEVYAFSVFKNPLVERFGVGLTPIAIIFSISIVMLGLSAAVFGTWVERAGPRAAMFTAALCWSGGFATVPAYLKDLFGVAEVGAIHGRLLTAWSAAGVAGPLIINAIADYQISAGRTGADLYTLSLYIMVGVLVVGFTANLLVRPVDPKFHMQSGREEESEKESTVSGKAAGSES